MQLQIRNMIDEKVAVSEMTVSNQDVKKKSFIHKIFTTKEKEGSGSSDFSVITQSTMSRCITACFTAHLVKFFGHIKLLALCSLLSKQIFLNTPLRALEVFAQIGAQKRHILWNKWSQRSRLHCAVAAQDPVGLGLPLEDDVVLIVGHFRDSSEQRIRFPSSDDCVCGKENLGRVEDPRRFC
ncbi:hypothetical protein ACFX2K_029223 [Malus domestica]